MKQSFRFCLVLLMAICLIPMSCSKLDYWNNGHSNHKKDVLPNDVILEWNAKLVEAAGGVTYLHALYASRANAMMHIAMHDAVNAVIPLYEQYAFHGKNSKADPILASAKAAHTVLSALFPENMMMLDELLDKYMDMAPDGESKDAATMLGMSAGNAILQLRQNDGATENPVGAPIVSNVPGVYNTVPPLDFVFGESWKNMMPFSLTSPSQFRSHPPPALTSQEYTKAFNEVKELGSVNSTTRTEDESFYGAFWYEYVELGWNRIARTVSEEKDLKLLYTARLFALMNMAIIDSYIGGWDSKFHYNFWRPYTAIRRAAFDGNPNTIADGNWLPYLPTPPVPDYPSTHSVGANAAATVLDRLIMGNQSFTFGSSTAVPQYAERTFKNFKEAADENAYSRTVIGIHFGFATKAGQKMGDEIGKWAVKNHLEPLK